MAVPLVGIYMPLYDNLLAKFRAEGLGDLAPLAAGCLSRGVSVFCVGPLELLRTRQQAQVGPLDLPSAAGASSSSLMALLRGAVSSPGAAPALAVSAAPALPHAQAQAALSLSPDLRLGFTGHLRLASLWRGTSATLLRDIPFSAMYWTFVEQTRAALKDWLERYDGLREVSSRDSVIALFMQQSNILSSVSCPAPP